MDYNRGSLGRRGRGSNHLRGNRGEGFFSLSVVSTMLFSVADKDGYRARSWSLPNRCLGIAGGVGALVAGGEDPEVVDCNLHQCFVGCVLHFGGADSRGIA